MPGGVVGTLGPFAVLAASGVYLAARWNDIPERFVVHWGTHGPNGWATRSIPGVFGPLIIGAVVCAFIMGLRYAMMTGAPTDSDAEREQRRGTLIATLVVQFNVVMIVSLLAVLLPFRTDGRSIAPIMLTVVGLAVVGMVVALVKGVRPTPVRGGLASLGNRDAQNQPLFVPKRLGIGYTINFAHPQAWLALAIILAFPLSIVILTIVLQRTMR